MCLKINPHVSIIMSSRSLKLFEQAIKSHQTHKVYMYSLHEFMKFIKIEKYDDIPKLDTESIQKFLEDWIIDLSERDLKANTIIGKLSAVELFLDMNKVIFHKKIIHRLVPSTDYIPGGDKAYTTDEIQRILDSTTKLRTKALIHFLASTGVRPASITDPVLRLKHIEDMPNGCKSLKIYEGSKERYWAFLTPEASKALKHYFSSRKINGEKLGPESPMFANYEKPNTSQRYSYLSEKSVRNMIQNLIKISGIERIKEGNRFEKATVYGFRKRFFTVLKLNNEVNFNIAEKLMGHKKGLDGSYLKPTKEECFVEFFKAIPELTINDEARDKAKITQLQKEKSEIEEIKEEIIEIKKRADMEKNLKEAFAEYHETGSDVSLKQLDIKLLEELGYWKTMRKTGKLPLFLSKPYQSN